MAATSSPSKTPTSTLDVVDRLGSMYPDFTITAGDDFQWSPSHSTITYPSDAAFTPAFIASLCHELAHGLLEHSSFRNDIELIKLERSAWERASDLTKALFDLDIPNAHIEKCLDTYRDWLYARSLCPTCKQCGLQTEVQKYHCVFCNTEWKVNLSRLCKVQKRRV
jgi:hypothetical protein